jgi:hypothetical protein
MNNSLIGSFTPEGYRTAGRDGGARRVRGGRKWLGLYGLGNLRKIALVVNAHFEAEAVGESHSSIE